MIVPFPAGGATDLLARALGLELTEKLGQQFVIDNRTGATGNIGAAAAAKAPADGYTILFSTPGPIALNQLMSKGLSFDPQKDFTPIVLIAKSPHIYIAKKSLGREGPRRASGLCQGQSRQDQCRHSGQRHHRPHFARAPASSVRRESHPRALPGRRAADGGYHRRADRHRRGPDLEPSPAGVRRQCSCAGGDEQQAFGAIAECTDGRRVWFPGL